MLRSRFIIDVALLSITSLISEFTDFIGRSSVGLARASLLLLTWTIFGLPDL